MSVEFLSFFEQTLPADTRTKQQLTNVKTHAFITYRECATRFLASIYFHYSNPSGSLINMLKYFQILFRFHLDIRIFKKKTPQCTLYCRVSLRGVHHTVESDSVVCIIPRSQTLGCALHRLVKKTKYL